MVVKRLGAVALEELRVAAVQMKRGEPAARHFPAILGPVVLPALRLGNLDELAIDLSAHAKRRVRGERCLHAQGLRVGDIEAEGPPDGDALVALPRAMKAHAVPASSELPRGTIRLSHPP